MPVLQGIYMPAITPVRRYRNVAGFVTVFGRCSFANVFVKLFERGSFVEVFVRIYTKTKYTKYTK